MSDNNLHKIQSVNKRQQQPVPYDQIAPTFDQRYVARTYEGITNSLRSLVKDLKAEQILEVGCGTGHWLDMLQNEAHQVYGLDLSPGMLQEARKKGSSFYLVCGRASQLPYPDASFDLIFCVNAFHHFPQPILFINEAYRLLRPGGALAIIGGDPHTGRDRWFVYDYFESTWDLDITRFPSSGAIVDWMANLGMNPVERKIVERLVNQIQVQSVADEPFLKKNETSQLILLPEETYAAGLRRIEQDLEKAKRQGKQLQLRVDIALILICGYKSSL